MHEDRPPEEETPKERADRELIELLTELRVVLPGTTVLLGFLLAVPFAKGWTRVTEFQRDVFIVAFLFDGALGRAPHRADSYHRLRFRHGDKATVVKFGNRLSIAGIAASAVSLEAVVLLVTDFVLSRGVAIAAAASLFVVVLSLWYVLPLWASFREIDPLDDDVVDRTIGAAGLHLFDRVHDVHPVGDAAEDRVLPVEPRARVGGDDEELAAVGVRAGVRHRERAALDRVVVELVLEGVAGAARAGAGRVAALDHEVGDHTVEDHTAVEAVAGELAEILDRLRRLALEQLDLDRAVIGMQGRCAHRSGTLSGRGQGRSRTSAHRSCAERPMALLPGYSNRVRVSRARAFRPAIVVAALAVAALFAASALATGSSERNLPALNRQVLAAVNKFRVAHGLVALRPASALDRSARQHSLEMGRVGYFDHPSADGTAFWKRIQTIAIVVNTATRAASSRKASTTRSRPFPEPEAGGLPHRACDGLFGHGSPPRLSTPIAFPLRAGAGSRDPAPVFFIIVHRLVCGAPVPWQTA